MASQAIVILTFLYFLPLIIGGVRKVPNLGSVFVVNLFLGWSFVGWVAALAMASRSVHPGAPMQTIVIQNSVSHGTHATLPAAHLAASPPNGPPALLAPQYEDPIATLKAIQ